MKTLLRKFVPLLAAFLVTVGGLLAFESFTAERVEARGTRTILVCQRGAYIANLCIKNQTTNNQACTGNIGVGIQTDLNIDWQPGDRLDFINNVMLEDQPEVDKEYINLAERDTICWSGGALINDGVKAYCRAPHEADCKPEPCDSERLAQFGVC
jgi:hypothetical protein